MLQHCSKKEFFALENLHKSTNIAIQKSDKDKSAVTVDNVDYLDKLENFAINQEKCAKNIFKKLVASNSISEKTRRSLKPVGIRSGITYGLHKVHEDVIDNCPSF